MGIEHVCSLRAERGLCAHVLIKQLLLQNLHVKLFANRPGQEVTATPRFSQLTLEHNEKEHIRKTLLYLRMRFLNRSMTYTWGKSMP